MLRLIPVIPFILSITFVAASKNDVDDTKVSVRFYGESQCPFCRKFVEEAWNEIWSDLELRSHIDYDFVPWGNAYFTTTMCGSGPYDPKERACFYDKCITSPPDDEDACFGGEPIYQHSLKEGEVDIYESCILRDYSLEQAVDFTYCAEGKIMDYTDITPADLLKKCVPKGVDASKVLDCKTTSGRQLEIANAKKTPVHPGVPYVVVDGKPMDDPFKTKETICNNLQQQGVQPKSCGTLEKVIESSLRKKFQQQQMSV